ncbi:transcription initiation factor TFIID subunit 7 [Nematocida homosporus]|uniref:transcription initiation factor TFIID subunit 7 n=1 Tax=Nematocida homosporus TaxID=1912981 RepID=UPI00221F976C|nr:transcription initiation factor TFIID subunit 7 [Nematocida homosporus]KAI5184937.1 transcription initiation factor TFIID subunit 7 [Nematocida homosporus]
MEDQFIIRPPESIKDKLNEDVKKGAVHKITIKMISSKEGILTYEGKTYTGYLVDLPCIVESHKTLDNKQFIKIADISKIFVFSDDSANAQKIAEEASLSGLTPPMKYVRNRRFRQRLTKAPIIEEIEKAVARLLEMDKEALRVDVQVMNKDEGDESEEDVSSLAAEIELNLMESEKITRTIEPLTTEQDNEELSKKEEELKDLLIKLQEKKEQLETITNPILRKRFQEGVDLLEQEKNEKEKEIAAILNQK